jgi:hypothetical protein
MDSPKRHYSPKLMRERERESERERERTIELEQLPEEREVCQALAWQRDWGQTL